MRRLVTLTLLAGLVLPGTAAATPVLSTLAQHDGDDDGVPMANPEWVTPSPDGTKLFLAEFESSTIRQFNANGTGHRVWAGVSGSRGTVGGVNGDGGPPLAARFDLPLGPTFRKDGSALVVDLNHHKVRLISADGRTVSTIVGSGTPGTAKAQNVDGVPAKQVNLRWPGEVSVLEDGMSFLIADAGNHVIRRYDATTGRVDHIAGTGDDAEADHPTDPHAAKFTYPQSVALARDGTTALVTDRIGSTVRRVRLKGTGTAVETVAGVPSGRTFSYDPTPWGSGGAWTSRGLPGYTTAPRAADARFQPITTTPLDDGSFLVFDLWNHRIRRVFTTGAERTVAGNGQASSTTGANPLDGVPLPHQGFVRPNGDLVFAEIGGQKIRRIANSGLRGMAPAWVRIVPPPPVEPAPATTPAPAVPAAAPDPAPASADPEPAPADPPAAPAPPTPPTPPGPAQVPPPVPNRSVVVTPVRGTVTVRTADGRFRRLAGGENLPFGATLDATAGSVALTSARPGGAMQTATFAGGMFTVRSAARGVTDLVLTGGSFAGCPKVPAATTARTAARRKPVRRLWGDGKGRFRTRGRNSAATVRGTVWLVEDRCEGTLTRVKRGVVAVRDRRTGRTRLVRAGQQLLVRTPSRRARRQTARG
jgi:hypothetical protein